ncbi:MAG: ligase-associated DNA damage response endonuclease PdeM [Sphingomonadaceae bacterium]
MPHALSFAGEVVHLLGCGALFWPREALLVVADLHLEKGSAMARAGWLVPPHDSIDALDRLADALARTGARHVLALGDSFHDRGGPMRLSDPARTRLAGLLSMRRWTWVVGNHDGACAAALGGEVVPQLCIGGIAFRHEADRAEAGPEISGHFHPKVRLPTASGGTLARRCFALAGNRLVLPAYGSFAGGLDIASADLAHALGEVPEALVPLADGIARWRARARAA